MKKTNLDVPALESGMLLLETLSNSAAPLPPKELAERVGKAVSSTYRMVNCLEKLGYIYRDELSGNIGLTLKLYGIANLTPYYERMLPLVSLPILKLTQKLNESCHISVLDRDNIRIIYNEDSPGDYSLNVKVGNLQSSIATTSGLLILAHMEESRQLHALNENDAYRTLSKKKQKQLIAQLGEWSKKDFVIRLSENTHGVLDCVAILKGPWVASPFTIALPCIQKWSLQDQEKIILPALKKTQAEIKTLLGQSAEK